MTSPFLPLTISGLPDGGQSCLLQITPHPHHTSPPPPGTTQHRVGHWPCSSFLAGGGLASRSCEVPMSKAVPGWCQPQSCLLAATTFLTQQHHTGSWCLSFPRAHVSCKHRGTSNSHCWFLHDLFPWQKSHNLVSICSNSAASWSHFLFCHASLPRAAQT